MTKDPSVRLSPPQYTYVNFLKHSIGNDPCVDVMDIEEIVGGDYLIPIHVKCREKAIALATILELHKTFGNINIFVEVCFCNQVVKPIENIENIERLVQIVRQALDTNCYFEFVRAAEPFPGLVSIFPVFKKEVIQFFNDDLSDLYANFNGVAAHVFSEVMKSTINGFFISPSTTREDVC